MLVRRNALQITDTSFDGDCQRLAAAIRLVLQKAPAVEQERLIATSTPPAQPESDKSSTETAKVVHPLPAKAFKPDHVKPPPPKQRIAFLATAAVLVLAGVIYLAIVAFHSRPPPPQSPSSPVPAVTPIPPVIVTPTVGEKVPPTPEVTVQPTTQPTARATPTTQPTTPPPTRSPERTPEPVGKGIDDYFGALPPQDFTKSAPSDLLQIIRSGGKNILDRPNGYMFLNGDRAQVSLQIALFRDASQRPFLAIAWGNMGGPDFTHLSFFTERDGRMVPAKRTILPVGDSDELRFELPRIGLTLVVRDSSGKVLSKWTWNGERERFESTTPPPTRSPERTPESVVKSIDDYFGALPPQDFTKSAPSDLLQIIRSGGKNILDRPNGYMFLNGDRAQVSLQIALFPDASQRPFLAIAWGNMGGPDFTHLSFFTERDGRMVPAKRTILPVGDSDELRFELPRIGLTLVVRDTIGVTAVKSNKRSAGFESCPAQP